MMWCLPLCLHTHGVNFDFSLKVVYLLQTLCVTGEGIFVVIFLKVCSLDGVRLITIDLGCIV